MVRKIRVSGISSPYFSQIIEQQNGFRFAKPVRPDEKALTCVVPILQTQTQDRRYVTFPEVDYLKVHDTGHISQMIVENSGKEIAYIRTGTILKGATQERAIVRSYVIFPGQKVTMEARCVHQSKGIREGASVTYSGIIPLDMEKSLYDEGYKPKDQMQYWSGTQTYSSGILRGSSNPDSERMRRFVESGRRRAMPPTPRGRGLSGGPARSSGPSNDGMRSWGGSFTGSGNFGDMNVSSSYLTIDSPYNPVMGGDDLVGTQAEFATSQAFVDLLSKLKLVDDQAGLAILDEQGLSTVEMFDVHASWKALHEDAVKRAGTNLVRDSSGDLFEFKEDRAVKKVCDILGGKFKENVILDWREKDGMPAVTVLGLTGEHHIGELVELDGRVIHMVLNRVG